MQPKSFWALIFWYFGTLNLSRDNSSQMLIFLKRIMQNHSDNPILFWPMGFNQSMETRLQKFEKFSLFEFYDYWIELRFGSVLYVLV